MPIYEYACGSCGHHFEAKQRFDDDPIAECPECGQTVRRVLHPAGIIFKGSGFYINDSRNGNASSGSSPAKSSNGGSKSESKSEAKPDTVSSSTTDSESS
jgi:putative FmdB family regulatory protein